jgi:hypothetical protein
MRWSPARSTTSWWSVPAAPGCGPRLGMAERAAHRLHHQGLPDPQPHGCGAGRHIAASATWARTTGAGTCTTPSRAPTGSATRTPSSTCAGSAIPAVIELEHYGVPFSRTEDGQDLPAPLRRHDHELRRRPAGAAHLRGGRPHRPRHPAHAVSAVAEARRRVLHRVFRPRPDHGRRRESAAASWRMEPG